MKQHIDALKDKFRRGQHADAIAGCEALCREHPAKQDVKRLCATMHALVGNHARALELLHQVRNPDNEDPDILFNIATCEREMRNFENADRFFRIYTDRFAAHADGWASWAECKFQLNEFEEGLKLAERAIGLDGSLLAAWSVRGNCQKSLGKFEEALASYRKANQIEPTSEASFNAGLVLAQTGRPSEALESLRKPSSSRRTCPNC